MDSEPTFVKVGVSLRERLPELNDTELRVLLSLGLRIDEGRQCWPKKTALAEECTRSERQVQRAIGSLIDKGFIWVGRRVGGRGKPNIYTLNGYFAYGHAPVQLIAPILYAEKGDIGAPKTASRKRETSAPRQRVTSAQDQQLRGAEAEKGDIDNLKRETPMEDEQLLPHERIKGDTGGGAEKGDIPDIKGDIPDIKGDIPDIKGDIGISEERETSALAGSYLQVEPYKKNHTRRTIQEDGEPLSQATKYLFEKTGRKRWANLVQKEKFEECERAVGADRLIEAIDWALTSGISNVKSIITAARGGKKERSDSGTRVRPKPDQTRRRPITRIPGA